MQIIKLAIKNFLSITDAEIKPGQINQIVGQNNQGKTTIIRALETCLKGSTDGSLVRHGSEMAEVVVEFDNGMKIHRKIREDGKQGVNVTKGEGLRYEKPQTMLDSLMAGISFNPLSLLEAKDRVKVLMQTIDIRLTEDRIKARLGDCPVAPPPVDYNQHGLIVAEQVHRYLYQRRAEANKEAKKKEDFYKVKLAETPEIDTSKLPKLGIAETELRAQISELRLSVKNEMDKEKDRKKAQELYDLAIDVEERARRRVSDLEMQLRAAQTDLTARVIASTDAKKKVESTVVDTAKINTINGEVDRLQAELDAIGYERMVTAQKETLFQFKSAADETKAFASKIDGAVEAVGPAFCSELIASAELPVAGLEYKNGQFLLDGSSIDNLSASAALKLAISIARKVAKDTKIICIDGAELLDEKSFADLHKEIEGDGFCYFITRVGEAFEATSPTDLVLKMDKGVAVQTGGVNA